MFLRVRSVLGSAVPAIVLVACVATGTMAGAVTATLDFDRFLRSDLTTAQEAMSAFRAANRITSFRAETFDDYDAWNGTSGTSNPQNTRVGSFTAGGTSGSGRSVINGGTALEVRNDNTMFWGRYNTDPISGLLGGNYLDSNDNQKMIWNIKNVGTFNTLAFFVIDAADVGGKFSIKVGDQRFSRIAGADSKLTNGNIHLVRIALSESVDSLTVKLMHDRASDGFAIDGAMIANVAPVPLPPAAALLLTGAVALAGLRRRRRRAATV